MSRRVSWPAVLDHAASLVYQYDTPVTLRQLFYRLVADETLPNTQNYYRTLSNRTAEARRNGTFPDLADRTSSIERFRSFDNAADALRYLRLIYRRDRTMGQPWTIVLGVEKAGLSAQLSSWFGDLGIPRVALGGYASQTLCGNVAGYVRQWTRPAVLIYAGDLDPTGEDIDRDFERRCGCFDKVIRIALTPEQVTELPWNPDPEVRKKLEDDPRAAGFLRKYGELYQYEVDALPPDTLRELYQYAIADFWDDDPYQVILRAEERDRDELRGTP